MSQKVAALVGSIALGVVLSGCTYMQRVDQPSPPSETQGAGAPSLSADGTFVVFASNADNVVPFDDNGATDVFIKNRSTGIVSLVSDCASSCVVPNGQSNNPAMSRDGRWVVYESSATDLVPGDTNGTLDIFLRDVQTGTTERVNLGAGGVQANGFSTGATVSNDGRYVVFASDATNLVANDTNTTRDIFRRDRQTATTIRLSVTTAGTQGNAGSYLAATNGTGRYTVFLSSATNFATDTNGFDDAFVRDVQNGTTTRVNVSTGGAQANGFTGDPAISSDGTTVAFTSGASNLVAGDTNSDFDVFVRTLATNTTTRVSLGTGTTQGNGKSELPVLSDNGNVVAFVSSSSNLVAGDTNNASDVFVRTRSNNTTTRASLADNETQPNQDVEIFDHLAISGDGNKVAFPSPATNLVTGDTNGSADIFLRDRPAGTTERINVLSEPVWNDQNDLFFNPEGDLSGDGRYVAFSSHASNLVPGDTNGMTDVFVRDNTTNSIERVSVSSSEVEANGRSDDPKISANGRFVIYASRATNLAGIDTNNAQDIFERDRQTGTTIRVNIATGGFEALNGDSGSPDVSDTGEQAVWTSNATNLVAGDTNGRADVFFRDGPSGITTRVSVGAGGVQGNNDSFSPVLGRTNTDVVAFTSFATNLAPGTENLTMTNAFVRVRSTAVTQRVDFNFGGVNAADGQNSASSLSADGRYVAFTSNATDVLPGDPTGGNEAYIRDRVTNTTERVDVQTGANGTASLEGANAQLSADARFALFSSQLALTANDTNFETDVYLRDRQLNRTTLVGQTQFLAPAPFGTATRAISDDGKYALISSQSALISGDSDNPTIPATLYERALPQPTVTSVTPTTVARNTTRTVTVNGTYFQPGVTGLFGTGIIVTNTNLVNEGRVIFTIQIAANAPTGARTVIVGNPGTIAGPTSGAAAGFTLTVT